jgi:hypothetical protein
MLILRNRSYLRRFSDCESAEFVRICFSGSERCGDHGAAFEVSHWIISAGPNMGTDTMFGGPVEQIEGQTRYLDRLHATGLSTSDGSGRRLRFHLGNNADIEVVNVS